MINSKDTQLILFSLLFMVAAVFAGCDNSAEDNLEDAGDSISDAAENVGDSVEDATN